MEFEWDAAKEVKKLQKHKISFSEAAETFFDSDGLKFIDLSHSQKEERFYWVGKSKGDAILTTWFTEREGVIRIIGCAQWRKFRRIYETPKLE